MQVTLIDDSVPFDGLMPTTRPLGGAEKAFASLAGALVRAGHDVTAINHCHADMAIEGAKWRTWDSTRPYETEALLAFRKPSLLGGIRKAKHRALWVTAHPKYLEVKANREILDSHRPHLIFVSETQRAAYRGDLACTVIPPGVRFDYLRDTPISPVTPPIAVVTTHPNHGLAWLLELWRGRIRPACPGAQLHIYSAALSRCVAGEEVPKALVPLAEAIIDARHDGVIAKRPDGDMYMADDYLEARLHLYPGHPEDWGCWTLAETQAMGLPAVARPLGAAPERLIDEKTGYLGKNDDEFVNLALQILTHDKVFNTLSTAARESGRRRKWNEVAKDFAAALKENGINQ